MNSKCWRMKQQGPLTSPGNFDLGREEDQLGLLIDPYGRVNYMREFDSRILEISMSMVRDIQSR
jgi:hypothetical protein